MILSTLDRYIGKSMLGAIFATLFALVGLSGIIKFVEQFSKIGRGSYDMVQAALYTILTMPKDVETFFPMAALLGALIALGNLASRSELVVMQAAGLSRLKIGMAVMKTALPLIIITMLIGEWGVPQTEQFARDMRAKAIYGGSVLSVKNSIWAKDGHDFVYVRRINANMNLQDVTIYSFNDQRELQKIRYAQKANFKDKKWTLVNIKESLFAKDNVTTNQIKSLSWNTSLTPDKLGIASLRPTSLSMSGLYEYIQFMKQTGQNPKRFELTFWQRIFQPISVSIMMLLALSFIFGQLRGVTAGARIVTGICFGFLFYVINEVFGRLSLIFDFSAILGALMPSIFFISIIWWLLHRKV